MKPVYQDKFGEGKGNCLQAAVASIFELDLSQVPDFLQYKDWTGELIIFCAAYGIRPVWLDRRNGDVGINIGPGEWWSVVTGKSPRGDYYHSVVAFNGEIVHDPHPDGKGQLGELADEIVFVVKNPAYLKGDNHV